MPVAKIYFWTTIAIITGYHMNKFLLIFNLKLTTFFSGSYDQKGRVITTYTIMKFLSAESA